MPHSGAELATLLRQDSRSVARRWAARMRLDGDHHLVRAEFNDRYLPSVLVILARLIESPSPEIAALYRDELQRYPLQLGHPLDPSTDNVFGFDVADLLAEQRAALLDCFGPGPILDTIDRLHETLLSRPALRVDMLLLGDCLMNGVRCFLAEDLRAEGIDFRGYHKYFSSTLSAHFDSLAARAFVARHPVSLIGFSPFTYDGLPVFRQLLMEAPARGQPTATLDRALDVIDHAVADIRSWSDGPILVHNACGAPVGPSRADTTSLPPLTPARLATIDTLNNAVGDRMRDVPGVLIVDEAALVSRIGLWEASRPAVTGVEAAESLHHTNRLGREIARAYTDVVVSSATMSRLRALAVDFDGTLWSGVMAEGAVEHHRERQALLRRLARQGVVLIGLSRGAPESVRWAEADIALADFVVVKRSWQPKPIGLAAALNALGITAEHVGSIDDDPTERAMLASAFPDLTVLDADDPAVWRRLAIAADLRVVTEDGARRTERYRTALQRDEFAAGHGGRQMMTSAMAALDLTVSYRPMRPVDMPRTLELLRRTNQFNTTGGTFSKQMLARMTDPAAEHVAYVARLRDRFGDFGLVSAVIIHRERRCIESVVVSCRAMGYGVEQVLLDQVITECGTPIEARLVRTRLNEPCHGLFATAGFREYAPGRWRLDHYRPVHVPAHVSVEALDSDE